MTVRLRPHHLLCVLTYVGKGYSAPFVANLDAIAALLAAGEEVWVVDGPDDICAPLLGEDDAHCTAVNVRVRDAAAARDLAAVLEVPVGPEATVSFDATRLTVLRRAFASGRPVQGANGCNSAMPWPAKVLPRPGSQRPVSV